MAEGCEGTGTVPGEGLGWLRDKGGTGDVPMGGSGGQGPAPADFEVVGEGEGPCSRGSGGQGLSPGGVRGTETVPRGFKGTGTILRGG